jgi:hypothetical protein
LHQAVIRFSRIRWASRWECVHQLFKKWKEIIPLLKQTPYSDAIVQKLLIMAQKDNELRLELAVSIDFGKIITETIYYLEGDGFLIIYAYDKLKLVEAHLDVLVSHDSTVCANTLSTINELVIKESKSRAIMATNLLKKAVDMVKPAVKYYKEQLTHLAGQINIFKAAKLFNPVFVASRPLNPEDVNEIKCIAFFNNTLKVNQLKAEFLKYHSLATQCPNDVDPLSWWSRQTVELPHWSAACRSMILYQPSSAAAERVFSMLRQSIGVRQGSSLQDYQAASVMLAYNRRSD